MVRSIQIRFCMGKKVNYESNMDCHSCGYQHIAKRCPSCNVKETSRRQVHSGLIHKRKYWTYGVSINVLTAITRNIALYSRLPVSKINQELHHRLMTNDESTIRHFAYDTAVLKQNNAKLSGQLDFRIQERCLTSITRQYQICVRIRLTRSFRVSLLSIMKIQLMLSSADIRRRIDSGQITGVTAKMLKSRKLRQT